MVYNKDWSQTSNLNAVGGSAVDPFGRMRVSNPQTIFDSKQIYDQQELFWSEAVTSGTGSITYNDNQASTTLSLSNETGTIIRQTKRWFNYQPGKGQLVFITFTLGEITLNTTKRVGLFNGSDGLYFELDGDGLSVNVKSNYTGSPVVTKIRQSNWNIDTMNGGGDSRVTIDTTKSQIAVIDLEWLGVGSIRYGWVIDGQIVYCHQIRNANNRTGVYMSSPNLPLKYEISSTSNVTSSLECICACVISEGGQDETGTLYAIDRGLSPVTTNNDSEKYALLGIRLKSDRLGAKVIPADIHILCTSTAMFRWSLILNPTFNGIAPIWNSTTNGSIDYFNSTTNATTLSGGLTINSGYDYQSNSTALDFSIKTRLLCGSTVTGVQDVLVLAIEKVSAQTETFYGSMSIIDVV